jgi:hemoglobin
MRLPLKFCLLMSTLLLGACAGSAPTRPQPVAAPSLYIQLGGAPAVAALVDALVVEYKADPRIARRFDLPPDELAYLRERLIEQFCAATGGGCEYTGLSMAEAHSGMAIDGPEFDAFIEATVRAMTRIGVSDEHQLILLSVLDGMRGDVVGQ